MSVISQFEYENMQRRVDAGRRVDSSPLLDGNPVERESDLHDQIEAELKRRRWYYVHSRMDRATTTQLGVTDFIIAAPPTGNVGQPRTFWVECKREGEKLNKEQTVTKHVLLALGHKHFVVFSFEEFLDQIK